MLTEKQLERYADVLIWGLKTARTKKYKKGDIVIIRYHKPAIRLAEILFKKLLEMGINPVQRVTPTPKMELDFYEIASNKQIGFIPPGDEELYKNLNGSIYLHAPESITHLSKVDSRKIGKTAVAIKPLRDILEKREEKGQFGWTLCSLPTEEQAKHSKLSMKEYTHQIVKACYLGKTNAVDEWKTIFKNAISIKKWLNAMKVKHYHVESQSMDLKVTLGEKRKWIGISGHNIPSFELFVSPDWHGTEGVYFANQPSYRSGNYVEDVKLTFKKGSVVGITAKTGEDFVKKQLAMDKGANKLGEFSLTDKRFSKINKFMANTLFDENFGGANGNCHVAVGASYSDTFDGDTSKLTKERKEKLGFNSSALHWDLVNTEKKKVTAYLTNGKSVVVYENGKFTY
ncbi:MAG: aminopeptidase [Desulfobacterales bacterium]|nr:aminopeptidase [Desulfobacterales bacterium]